MAEPGQLALGEAHGRGHDGALGLRLRHLAAQDRERLPVADRLQRPRRGRHARARAGRCTSATSPCSSIAPRARLDRARAARSRPGSRPITRTRKPRERRGAGALLGADRPPGRGRTPRGPATTRTRSRDGDPSPRGLAVDAGQSRRCSRASPCRSASASSRRAERLVARRALEEPVQQRPQVEAGAPGHHGEAAARPRRRRRTARASRAKAAAEKGSRGIGHVEQVVRHGPALGRGRLGGADVEARGRPAGCRTRRSRRRARGRGAGRERSCPRRWARRRRSGTREEPPQGEAAARPRGGSPRRGPAARVGALTAAGAARARSRSRGRRRASASPRAAPRRAAR